jgi:hypothetical protein
MAIQKIFSSRTLVDNDTHVGQENRVWFDEDSKLFYYSDGETPGGVVVATSGDAIKETGWAVYRDTQYTSVSPFVISDGNVVILPNNAGTVVDNQLPPGVTAFYDGVTNKLTPKQVGDYYIFTIRFKGVSTINGSFLDFGVNTLAPTGYIFRETEPFSKGAGTEHAFSFTCPGFVSSNFFNNGGKVMLSSVNGEADIYDIEYQIVRVHTA